MSEEKKISLEDLEELLAEEDTIGGGRHFRLNFQTIFSALVLNWHWFLLSLIICVCGALIYLRFAEPVYQVSARMLVKNNNDSKKKSASQMLSDVEDLGYLNNSSGIENEVEVLRSRLLLRDVVKDLKLYTEYRREDGLKDVIVYKNQPFSIDLDPEHLDSLDIAYLESSQWLKMEVWREGTNYMISGTLKAGAGDPIPFQHRAKSLPDTIKTRLGTLTMTAVPGKKLEEGQVYIVTISPPMQVATSYLSRLTIKPTTKRTDIALLTLKDNNYRRGVDVLRQLSICYNRQANAEKNAVAMRTEEFINDRMAKIDKELGSTEEEIQQFKQQNAVTSLSDASQSVQMSNEFSARLSEANSQVQMLDYMREYVNNPSNKYQIIPSNVGVSDGATTSLINNYNQAVQDRNRLLMSASEEAPQVKTLTATIDELQRSIQTALLQARSSADIRRQGIQSQFAKFQGRVSAAPIQERVLNQVGRQQDVKSTLYMLLLQKREENSIALAATADNGKLVDEPLNEGKVSPKNLIIILVAVLLGLLIPALCLWIISLFRYKIEGHDDVVKLTNLPILCDVPVASEQAKGKAGIVVKENQNNQMEEIFRSLRTNLQFMMKQNDKVILFTSTSSGEGKTFNCANLSVSFALLGKKVILVGLDIRRPRLAELFEIKDHHHGISTLLTKDAPTWEEVSSQVIHSGVNDNLDLLMAGPIPPNPTELIARDSLETIFNHLRDHYDIIIVDTAPVGLVTDTLQIGRVADVTAFICRSDYTAKSSFDMINSIAAEKKLPSMAIVINGIDMSKRKYGYAYGYGRYGKYGRYGQYKKKGQSYGQYGNYGNYGNYNDSHYGNPNDKSVKL